MHLTAEEEKMHDGEYGWALQVSMRILARLGDLFDATKLIPIESAHLSGVSYKTIGDAPVEFLEELAKTAGKARVETTLNPSCFDPDYPTRPSTERREKQRHIISLYANMGAASTLTCTPYYVKQPSKASHLAWAESSAVIYANSVSGAYTNREGSPSALAAALVGKTPDCGMHRPENREPTVLVNVETELRNEAEFGALGIFLGKLVNDKIPLLNGLPRHTDDDFKQLGAAMATSGMATMFEAGKPVTKTWQEKITVERRDIEKTKESLSTKAEKVDLVFLGCPHCSLEEMIEVAKLLEGRIVRDSLQLWVCTSRWLKERAKNYVNIIEQAGGHVVCDTCAVVTWLKELGINSVMTNSAKTAYYAPTMNKVDTFFAPLSECLKTACL
jgi:predicted aconitase